MRPEKQLAVAELKQQIEGAGSIVLTTYSGLSAEQMNELRGILDQRSAKYIVVKNRLVKIALEQLGRKEISEFLEGPVGVICGTESYSEYLKDLVNFNKENQAPEMLGGYIEQQVFGPQEMKSLAALPSKEELQAQFLGGLQAPITGFVRLMGQRLASFLRVLDAIAKKKEESGE